MNLDGWNLSSVARNRWHVSNLQQPLLTVLLDMLGRPKFSGLRVERYAKSLMLGSFPVSTEMGIAAEGLLRSAHQHLHCKEASGREPLGQVFGAQLLDRRRELAHDLLVSFHVRAQDCISRRRERSSQYARAVASQDAKVEPHNSLAT